MDFLLQDKFCHLSIRQTFLLFKAVSCLAFVALEALLHLWGDLSLLVQPGLPL